MGDGRAPFDEIDIVFPVANTMPAIGWFNFAVLEAILIWTIFCPAMHPVSK
jgi:hypothetical protein